MERLFIYNVYRLLHKNVQFLLVTLGSYLNLSYLKLKNNNNSKLMLLRNSSRYTYRKKQQTKFYVIVKCLYPTSMCLQDSKLSQADKPSLSPSSSSSISASTILLGLQHRSAFLCPSTICPPWLHSSLLSYYTPFIYLSIYIYASILSNTDWFSS